MTIFATRNSDVIAAQLKSALATRTKKKLENRPIDARDAAA
jgi:hypothetical protein